MKKISVILFGRNIPSFPSSSLFFECHLRPSLTFNVAVRVSRKGCGRPVLRKKISEYSRFRLNRGSRTVASVGCSLISEPATRTLEVAKHGQIVWSLPWPIQTDKKQWWRIGVDLTERWSLTQCSMIDSSAPYKMLCAASVHFDRHDEPPVLSLLLFFSLDQGFFCFIWLSGVFYWKCVFLLWSNYWSACCITAFSIQEYSSFTGVMCRVSIQYILSRARLNQIVWNLMFYRLSTD